MIQALQRACAVLSGAEREIRLLARCQPVNLPGEITRLQEAWLAGRLVAPSLIHKPAPRLGAVRRTLEALAEPSVEPSLVWDLVSGRARELAVEAEVAEAIGSPGFSERAARRFAVPRGEIGDRCEAFIRRWARPAEPGERDETADSDDHACAWSLVSLLTRTVGRLRLPIRVGVVPALVSTAATAEGAIYLREGIPLTRRAATRIAVHELAAHALPRYWANKTGQPLLAVGTAGAAEAEEGRALLIEERLGLMDAKRSAELAFRHCACRAVRDAAEWGDLMALLTKRGATTAQAVSIALRAIRGGGLAREIVYLPSFFELSDSFARMPGSEGWFEFGRVSADAAGRLERLGPSWNLPRNGAAAMRAEVFSLLLPDRQEPGRGPRAAPPSARSDRSTLTCSARANFR